MNGHDELVQILLDKGLEIDDQDHDNSSSLHLAAVSGKTSTAKILISKGAALELQGLNNATPLLFATCYQKIGVAKFLLQLGANQGHFSIFKTLNIYYCRGALYGGVTIASL